MPDSLLFWKGVSAFRAGHQFDVIGGRLVVFLELDILSQHDVGQFHRIESDQVQIGVQFLQIGQFQAQELFVPAGVQGELVVGDDVGPLLRFGQVGDRCRGPSSVRAAAPPGRPWPAMMPSAPSSRIGFVNPNSLMLAAICAICSSECVRGFLAYGTSSPIGLYLTLFTVLVPLAALGGDLRNPVSVAYVCLEF